MKKLYLLLIFLFIPMCFLGCTSKTQRIGNTAFTNLNEMVSYKSTAVYEKDGKEFVESCITDKVFDYVYYYYSLTEDGQIKKEAWYDNNDTRSYFYSKINGEVQDADVVTFTSSWNKLSENSFLLLNSEYNFTEKDIEKGELETINRQEKMYELYLYDYTFSITQSKITKIIYNQQVEITFEESSLLEIPNKDIFTPNEEYQQTFDEVLDKVGKLETLAKQYILEKTLTTTSRTLVLNYLRSKNYATGTWNTFLGEIDTGFVSYVNQNQGEDNVSSLRDLRAVTTPLRNEEIDFSHLMAVVAMADKYGINSLQTNLAGYGGDIAQLTAEIKDATGTKDELYAIANESFASNSSTFGMSDLLSDIDAINLSHQLLNKKSLSLKNALKNYYYTLDRNQSIAKATYLLGTSKDTKTQLISGLTTKTSGNMYIVAWLTSNGVSLKQHSVHLEVCVEVFANFMYNNM